MKGADEAGQDALEGKARNLSETGSWEAFIVQGFTSAEPPSPANSE